MLPSLFITSFETWRSTYGKKFNVLGQRLCSKTKRDWIHYNIVQPKWFFRLKQFQCNLFGLRSKISMICLV